MSYLANKLIKENFILKILLTNCILTIAFAIIIIAHYKSSLVNSYINLFKITTETFLLSGFAIYLILWFIINYYYLLAYKKSLAHEFSQQNSLSQPDKNSTNINSGFQALELTKLSDSNIMQAQQAAQKEILAEIIHDLRSPLLAIDSLLLANDSTLVDKDYATLKLIIARIKEILDNYTNIHNQNPTIEANYIENDDSEGEYQMKNQTHMTTDKSKWLPDKIVINSNSIIAVLDDDISIIMLWKNKLSAFNLKAKYFTTVQDFLGWFQQQPSNSKDNLLLLTDYELHDKEYNGVDLIIKLKVKDSYLVTSYAKEIRIQELALKHNFWLLAKSNINTINFEFV